MQIDINENKKLDDLSNNSKYKKFILIKVPAKVKNKDKATSLLGGCGNIIHKYFKNENIDLKLFHKKLPLEKCICNDLIIKRKTKRSKTNPTLIKYEYEIIGKADCQYECFAMHDFVYFNKYSFLFEKIKYKSKCCIDFFAQSAIIRNVTKIFYNIRRITK